MPELYLFGGPNGAGKTTIALKVLPLLGCGPLANADAIASGFVLLQQAVARSLRKFWMRMFGRAFMEIPKLTREMMEKVGNQAVAEAIETHRRMGRPIVVWQDNQVRWIAPEEIEAIELPGDAEAREVLLRQQERDKAVAIP